MNISKDTIIADVVAKDYRAASIFKENDMDFCCNGHRSIGDVCNEKNIATDKLIDELENITKEKNGEAIDFNSWELDLLADYIQKKHHRYVEAKIPEIKPYLAKIAQVHGGNHPELLEVEEIFNQAAGDMVKHMKKEELLLFPFIRKMVAAKTSGTKEIKTPMFGDVQTPIREMMSEHDDQGEAFKKISILTDNYFPPEDACNTYKVTLSLLEEFEDDLHKHVHLENNILFPKAMALEEQFTLI